MALFVEKINADTSFILTFAPAFTSEKTGRRSPGAYTILVDPWLVGECSMWHPNFQLSHHTSECSYGSLADLPSAPDMILVSQDKPDHCHRATLCSMPKEWSSTIVAPSSAARKILSWNHFNPKRVQVLESYSETKSKTIWRCQIPPYMPSSSPGELTIAFLPSKHDVTGLHTAIGITYRSPGLPRLTQRGEIQAKCFTQPQNASLSMIATMQALSHDEQTMSVIYTPHGVQPSVLKPYIRSHLMKNFASPPAALFHSMNMEVNPWLMGGVVVAGAPAGCELAKYLGVRHWFGAHDEVKSTTGIAVKWVKSHHYDENDVRQLLKHKGGCEALRIHVPEVGEIRRITN